MLKKDLRLADPKKPMTQFDGVLVLGNNNKSDNPMVAVYGKGAMLNDLNPRPHMWPNWTTDRVNHKVVRNYPMVPNEVELLSKSEFNTMAGITLKSSENGYRLFRNTLLGDVLYITYDENHACFQEAIRCGFIDRKQEMHIDKALAKAA